MSYVNTGAMVHGRRVKSKKELKELAKASPESLRFDKTSMFDPGYVDMSSLHSADTLSVVGPDPYNDRRWYASVTRKADGTLKVA